MVSRRAEASSRFGISRVVQTLLGMICLLCGSPSPAASPDPLIGTPAKKWDVKWWMHSPALRLEDLRGKVVLVRWWTAPGCPFCSATAPALNEFDSTYRSKGLQVIGFYHHKAPTRLRTNDVARVAGKFGFKFPIAVDDDWRTLKHWWLDTGKRDFTSVSFLIDRKGMIRHIHPGGEYVKGDADYTLMKSKIEELLRKP